MLTHISLFSGLGADDLAAEWAGFTTILQCEIDRDCQKVLKNHWLNVPLIEDVRNVTRESVEKLTTNSNSFGCVHRESEIKPAERGEYAQRDLASDNPKAESVIAYTEQPQVNSKESFDEWGKQVANNRSEVWNISSTDGRAEFRLTLLTAGVPCQPASSAGKRRGKEDVRWLWPEAIRVLSELQPTWAVFENPTGIGSLVESSEGVSMGSEADQTSSNILSVELSNIIADIEAKGYEVQPVSISAASVGAPHKRQRIFILAHRIEHGENLFSRPGRLPDYQSLEMERNQERVCLSSCQKQGQLQEVRYGFNAQYGISSQPWRRNRPYQWEQIRQQEKQFKKFTPLSELPDAFKNTQCLFIKWGEMASEILSQQKVLFLRNISNQGRGCISLLSRQGGVNQSINLSANTDESDNVITHSLSERGNGNKRQSARWNEPQNGSQFNPDSWESGLEGHTELYKRGFPKRTKGSWSENWFEVAQRLCSKTQPLLRGMDARFADWLDNNWRRITDENLCETTTRQDLPDLWNDIQPSEIQRCIREQSPLLKEDYLLPILCKLQVESNKPERILRTCQVIQENAMRTVWIDRETRRTPQGQGYQKQHTGEYSDSLSYLSLQIALATESIIQWCEKETDTSNRTSRLKMLGNCNPPQMYYQVYKVIAEIENVCN